MKITVYTSTKDLFYFLTNMKTFFHASLTPTPGSKLTVPIKLNDKKYKLESSDGYDLKISRPISNINNVDVNKQII